MIAIMTITLTNSPYTLADKEISVTWIFLSAGLISFSENRFLIIFMSIPGPGRGFDLPDGFRYAQYEVESYEKADGQHFGEFDNHGRVPASSSSL